MEDYGKLSREELIERLKKSEQCTSEASFNTKRRDRNVDYIRKTLDNLLGSNIVTYKNILPIINKYAQADISLLLEYNYSTNIYEGISFTNGSITLAEDFPETMPHSYIAEEKYYNIQVHEIVTVYKQDIILNTQFDQAIRKIYPNIQSAIIVPVLRADKFYSLFIVIRLNNQEPWKKDEQDTLLSISKILTINGTQREMQKMLDKEKDFTSLFIEKSDMHIWEYDTTTDTFLATNGNSILKRLNIQRTHKKITFGDLTNIIHPEDILTANTSFQKVLFSGEIVTFQVRLHTNQGRNGYEWFEIKCVSSNKGNNNKSSHVIGQTSCINYFKETEKDLRRARQELSLAIESNELIVWLYKVKDHSIKLINSFNEFFENSNVTADAYIALIHPEDLDNYINLVKLTIAGKTDNEKIYIRMFSPKLKTYRNYSVHIRSIRSQATNTVTHLVGTVKDVTETIQKQKALEEYKIKTQLVIETSEIVLWDYDILNQLFTSQNKDSIAYNSISNIEYMQLIHPNDIENFQTSLQSTINGEQGVFNVQCRVMFTDSNYHYINMKGVVCEKDKEGKPLKLTGLRIDETQLRKMNEDLIILKNKAEESNRLKSAFLANMSHEIRTPLNAIVGFSQQIVDTDDEKERQEYGQIIQANNDLLLQLINDILDLSKIESGHMTFVIEETNISNIFYELQQVFQLRIQNDVEIISQVPYENCIVNTDGARLTQVISNFMGNACKFTTHGTITLGYEVREEGIYCYVKDTGIGISEENCKKVFERFSKFNAFIPGTGLGLAISQNIMEHLQGSIGVESELGKGSTFWIIIPRKSIVSIGINNLNLRTEELMDNLNEFQKKKKVVLVAEDNESNYLLISRVIEKLCDVIQASDGEEAIRLYKEKKPDLILMDIKMPKKNGLEVTKYIRSEDKEIPIIAVSAHAFDEDRENAMAAGCNMFITKPINFIEIREIIKGL